MARKIPSTPMVINIPRQPITSIIAARIGGLTATPMVEAALKKPIGRPRSLMLNQSLMTFTPHGFIGASGGTGIPDEMIAKAISLGVSKININTECQLVFAEATRKYIEEGKDQQGKGFDPRKLLAPGAKAIEAKCKEKIELFGCAGKG